MKIPVAKILLIALCLLTGILPSAARITMPKIFTDNLVLQQQTQAPVWGKATPKQEVTITTSWDKKTYKVRADEDGKWKVTVQTPAGSSTPYTITISDGKAVTLKNILIGEVWICSGQSNMDMPLAGWGWTKVINYEQEVASADYPQIRLLQVDKVASNQPLDDLKGTDQGWQVCSPATIPEFSAVAYFFGRNLYEHLNVPIGLINAAWGGTVAEAWTSGESLDFMPDFSAKVKEVAAYSDEEAQKRYAQQMEAWNETVLSATLGSNKNWESPAFNDNDWQTMRLPGIWEEKGLDGFDGLVLFRKTVDIPAAWAGKDLQLNLGMIDDNEITWFNGQKVGETLGYNSDRSYRIPARLVKAGKAVIAVHVLDYGGEGGFHSDPSFLSLALATKKQSSISLANEWKYKTIADKGQLAKAPVSPVDNANRPTVLHNAMIRPIAPYAIQGAIWYQGEANVGRAEQYRTLFPLMIQDWRKTFGKNIPFYFVQLANYMDEQPQPIESAWAELRDAQLHTLTLENTGMAVAIDIGEAKDIHPRNKQDVGLRLALAARANTYKQDVVFSGPVYQSHSIEGNTIRVKFNHTHQGLKSKDNAPLKGFAIAGPDHKYYWADAVIAGNEVVVSSPKVKFPVSVRYAWADNPVCNLYNGAGLPASPFQTQPVSIIFDTDMGCDYDDVGALTMLHALADSGEVRILATLVCLQSIGQNIGTDVINHYYGCPDLPLGRPINGMSNDCEGTSARWLAALDTHFPHRVRTIDDVPDAVEVYRRILAGEPDTSVVVVTVGALTNLSNLLQSPPDKYSPLDGKQLVAKKVKRLVAMAGTFPEGRESNASWDAPSSAIVFKQWPTRIIFSGWETGNEIVTGKRLRESGIQNTPAKEVYTICGEHQPRGRESWDQTAVLVGVRDVAQYFNTVKGQIKFEEDGSNSWEDNPNGKHEYLTWKMPIDELTKVIEDLMMHEPVNGQKTKRIPLIYSSDLYHPHGDPDDHYDLAMLNALDAFDVKAHIFDLSIPGRNPEEYGLAPLRQMAAIANKPLPPYAAGLRDALTSPDDKGENQPKEYQKGVELLLKTLRESDEKVTLFLVGSCRDFAAAYNREPELLKQKVAAVYVNAGNGPDGIQVEWNVFVDPQAYVCLMNSGLPIYWSPCFSKEERTATPQEVTEKSVQAFNTYFIVPNQAELLKNTSAQVKNFFTYALSKSQDEPLQYLNRSPENLPETPRSMWCTAPFLHAAGWKIYAYNNRYIACPPEKAKTLGIADKEVAVYEYKNMFLTSTSTEQATSEQFGFAKGHNLPVLKGVLTDSDAPVKVFRYIHPEYNEIMVSVLANILK